MSSIEEPIIIQTTNKRAVISLTLGIVTIVLFCTGIFIPIPFTSLICVPISALFGIAAIVHGLASLNRIKANNENVHPLSYTIAGTGILMAVFVLLSMFCMVAGILALFYFAPDYIYGLFPAQ